MKLNRRNKYLLLSVGTVIFLFGFSYATGVVRIVTALVALLMAVLGTGLVQYSSVTTEHILKYFVGKTFLSILVLPVTLVVGALLSLIYFPNLSLFLRVATMGTVGLLMYVISLVNNIFLVVYEREETIPLYRVAVTWSQILLVIVSIPFFSGVFKIPINAIYQTLIVAVVAGFFARFLMWVQDMDSDVPTIDRGEMWVNSLLVGFVVFTVGIATSFVPTESFLRALLLSSVLMSSLGYLQAHYKNVVTKKLVFEYAVILLIFLLFVLIFN
jgi:hypothetical protein